MLSQTMKYELHQRGEAVYFMVNIIILCTRYSFGNCRKNTPIIEQNLLVTAVVPALKSSTRYCVV